MPEPIHVGVCLDVLGRPEKPPFIYLALHGEAWDVGDLEAADILIAALQVARAHLREALTGRGGTPC